MKRAAYGCRRRRCSMKGLRAPRRPIRRRSSNASPHLGPARKAVTSVARTEPWNGRPLSKRAGRFFIRIGPVDAGSCATASEGDVKAIEITEFGGPEVLALAERPKPVPGPGEVLVKVCASGVNRPDVFQRKGAYAPPPGVS